MNSVSLGLDFGTESVRAELVDLRGQELASAAARYPHGQIFESLPGAKKMLPPLYALQHPLDRLDSAAKATRAALRQAKLSAANVLGIGGGVPVKKFVATRGLPHHNPLVVQVYADVLGEKITVHPSKQGPALGAAILGALAAGAFASPGDAIRAMAVPKRGAAPIFKPNPSHRTAYAAIYRRYQGLGDFFSAKISS